MNRILAQLNTGILAITRLMQGIDRDTAVAEACPQRLRPILMTAGISLVVLLPVAIAPKTGLDAYQLLAIVVAGGLLVGTVLSLFDIPIMHTTIDDLVNWLRQTGPDRTRE